MSKVTLVLATHNKCKQREYELLFKESPIEIRTLSSFGTILEFEEKGKTFKEIATKKAKLASSVFGLPALADDSGLEVEALNGAPGIFSARYAGASANDHQNNRKLLQEMEGRENRNATFSCTIALSKPDEHVLTYTGKCTGIILHEPVGTNGFGYDPCFFYPPLNKTFAQLTMEEKSKVSHRGQAMRNLKEDIERILMWLKEI